MLWIMGVGRGNYNVVFFDIESNGLPMISGENAFTGAAAMVEDVSITTGDRDGTASAYGKCVYVCFDF